VPARRQWAALLSPGSGAVDLADYLSGLGADTSGWQFWDVTGISADGSAITGYGVFNQGPLTAWVITGIPGPAGFSALCAGSLFMLGRRRRTP